MAQRPGPRSPDQAILMMRIIGLSLGAGITLFAIVGWFLHQQRGAVAESAYGSLTFNAFLALVALVSAGAIFVWRWRVVAILERPARETEWQARAAELQTGVIITWALLEGGALVGEVVYFLTGNAVAGALGVLLIWIGIALTWPKREWLPE